MLVLVYVVFSYLSWRRHLSSSYVFFRMWSHGANPAISSTGD